MAYTSVSNNVHFRVFLDWASDLKLCGVVHLSKGCFRTAECGDLPVLAQFLHTKSQKLDDPDESPEPSASASSSFFPSPSAYRGCK